MYDYSNLLGEIRKRGLTQADLANKIGISEATLNKKLKNKGQFNQSEMHKILSALGLPLSAITDYFFEH